MQTKALAAAHRRTGAVEEPEKADTTQFKQAEREAPCGIQNRRINNIQHVNRRQRHKTQATTPLP